MIQVIYNHELHGTQEIRCHELVKKEGVLHAKNIHGVTFQTLKPERIHQIESINKEKEQLIS